MDTTLLDKSARGAVVVYAGRRRKVIGPSVTAALYGAAHGLAPDPYIKLAPGGDGNCGLCVPARLLVLEGEGGRRS